METAGKKGQDGIPTATVPGRRDSTRDRKDSGGEGRKGEGRKNGGRHGAEKERSQTLQTLIALFTPSSLSLSPSLSLSFVPTMQPSRVPRPKPPSWSTPGHLVVFVRNLNLLHLDQREDWPDIDLSSLSDSRNGPSKRIKHVEWALYHLFVLWDPKTARDVCSLLGVLSFSLTRPASPSLPRTTAIEETPGCLVSRFV
jgi:hypothetical protein